MIGSALQLAVWCDERTGEAGTAIHIDEKIITDAKVDSLKIQPLARMGNSDYTKHNH